MLFFYVPNPCLFFGALFAGGRVDLLACSLLKLDAGQKVFAAIEAETGVDFAASTNATGNPTLPDADWVGDLFFCAKLTQPPCSAFNVGSSSYLETGCSPTPPSSS